MSIVVDTCELHSAFDGQCFGCVVASFHAQCRCISDLRDRVQKLEVNVAKVAEDLAQIHNNFDHADPVYAKLVKAHDELKALSPNGTEGGGNG